MQAEQTIGRYELIREIGRGGMAIVYLALDPYMRRQVAIKVLPRQFTFENQFRERFRREAQMIAALEHPAIVPVYDFGEHNEQPFLVMRYMAGGSLRQRMHGPLSFTDIEQILKRLAPALDRAHQRGIIHRDLKPENVLFDEENQAYLSDFGIARMAEATQTMTIVGTPAYMSPEQVQGDQKLDGRSDLYALGVILFELLTGQPPYTAPTPTKLMLKHILEPVPVLQAVNRDLPSACQGFIQQAMAKGSEERFATGAEMAAAFAQLAAGQKRGTGKETAVSDQTPVSDDTIVEPFVTPSSLAEATVVNEHSLSTPPSALLPTPKASTQHFPVWGWVILAIVLLAGLGSGAIALFGGGGKGTPVEEVATEETDVGGMTHPVTIAPLDSPATAALVEDTSLPKVSPTAIAPTLTLVPTVVPIVTLDPIEAAWLNSAHADAEAEAFVHWNQDDPTEIPAACAKCHSTPGFLDYVGADGSAVNVVDAAVPIGTVITCDVCHDTAVETISDVLMPSGSLLQGLGQEAACIQCHQGRSSTFDINNRVGTLDDDKTNGDLGFVNIHYDAAAASLFGTEAMGAYEYSGSAYVGRYTHVDGYDSCIECHDAHSLTVRAADCADCHENANSDYTLGNIRVSEVDWDGDGDVIEGVAGEIDTLRNVLLETLQFYASDWIGLPIAYTETAYPYFFADANADGQITGAEIDINNRYPYWTPRLLRAAYNYQFSLKDPGLFTHNPVYALQILYDSIEDVGGDTSGMTRP